MRQRRVPRGAVGGRAHHRDQPRPQAGRPARPGRLQGLLRGRRAHRHRHRRGLPRRAEPPDIGGLLDDQRHGRRLRRRAAVPVPPARVHGRGLHGRRGGDQRPLACAGRGGRLVAADHEGARRRGGAHPGRPPHRRLAAGRQRRAHLRARHQRLARDHHRERGLLHARVRPGRLQVPRCRPGHPGHQGPDADPRGPHCALPPLHRGHPRPVQVRAPPASPPVMPIAYVK